MAVALVDVYLAVDPLESRCTGTREEVTSVGTGTAIQTGNTGTLINIYASELRYRETDRQLAEDGKEYDSCFTVNFERNINWNSILVDMSGELSGWE